MKHVAAILQREKVYSLEFTTRNVRRGLSIGFWEEKELATMQVLSAGSLEPTIICCVGGSAEFIKALDKAPSQKAGIQYPFNSLPLQVERLMHKPSFGVMGKIDIFSMVRTLLVRFSALLDKKCTQSRQYFRRMRYLS